MLNTGPQNLTLATPATVANPYTYGGNEPVAVQIDNATGFLLQASAGGLVYLVQAYTALTIPLSGGGQNLTLLPFTGSATPPYNQCTETWLLAGEESPMPDGPLTAAAISAAIAGTVNTQYAETLVATVAGGTASDIVTLPAGTLSIIVLDPSANGGQCAGIGQTTGAEYLGFLFDGVSERWLISVDSTIDPSVKVQWNSAPTTTWYILAITAPYLQASIDAADNLTGTAFSGISTNIGAIVPGPGTTQPLACDLVGRLIPFSPTATASRLTTGVILARRRQAPGICSVSTRPATSPAARRSCSPTAGRSTWPWDSTASAPTAIGCVPLFGYAHDHGGHNERVRRQR